MTLSGGLAFFLLGMGYMTEGLKRAAGDRMRDLLGKLTRNRFSGLLSGALVTVVLQSSSITTVLLVGFASAGLIQIQQSVAVIMGANIGSTVTAQIIAFDVGKVALLMVAMGFGLHALKKRPRIQDGGGMLMGLGLIFFGIALMSEATYPLRSYPPAIEVLGNMQNPLLGLLAGAVFTAVVQSSAATTGLVIVLGSQGLLNLEAGIALALGANIGTCITALLASIGKSATAWRVSVVHILFNVVGALLWLPLIEQLAALATSLSPSYPDLQGTEKLAKEMPRQLANAHSLFNILNSLLLIGFTGPIATLAKKLVPERERKQKQSPKARFLDPMLLQTPSLAFGQAQLELLRLSDSVLQQLEEVIHALDADNLPSPDHPEALDTSPLAREIVEYLRQIGRATLPPQDSRRLTAYLKLSTHLDMQLQLIRQQLQRVNRERAAAKLRFSPETLQHLQALGASVLESLQRLQQAITSEDPEDIQAVLDFKNETDAAAAAANEQLETRLLSEDPHRAELYRQESEILNGLKLVAYHNRRMARSLENGSEHLSCPPPCGM